MYSYRSTSSTQQPYFEETELGQDLVSVLAVVNNVLARIPPSTITHLVDFDAALAMLNELLIMIRKVPGVYAVLVFGALQEGLCTWLVPCPEDETCFTAEQYDEKVSPIYAPIEDELIFKELRSSRRSISRSFVPSRMLHHLPSFSTASTPYSPASSTATRQFSPSSASKPSKASGLITTNHSTSLSCTHTPKS